MDSTNPAFFAGKISIRTYSRCKKTIQYCIDDIKEKENLAIISHVAQEMWQKEKTHKGTYDVPGG